MFSLWLRSSMEETPYWLSSSTQESRLQHSTFSSLEKHTQTISIDQQRLHRCTGAGAAVCGLQLGASISHNAEPRLGGVCWLSVAMTTGSNTLASFGVLGRL